MLLLSVVVVVVVIVVVMVVVDCSVGQWTGLEGGKYVGMIGRTMDGNILQCGEEEELVFLIIVIVCVFILRLRGSRMENVEIDLFVMMTMMIDLFFVCFTGPSRMMCGRFVVLLPVVVVGRGSIAIPGGGNGGFILYFYFFVFFAVLFFTQ